MAPFCRFLKGNTSEDKEPRNGSVIRRPMRRNELTIFQTMQAVLPTLQANGIDGSLVERSGIKVFTASPVERSTWPSYMSPRTRANYRHYPELRRLMVNRGKGLESADCRND